jgi:hypothetical protein
VLEKPEEVWNHVPRVTSTGGVGVGQGCPGSGAEEGTKRRASREEWGASKLGSWSPITWVPCSGPAMVQRMLALFSQQLPNGKGELGPTVGCCLAGGLPLVRTSALTKSRSLPIQTEVGLGQLRLGSGNEWGRVRALYLYQISSVRKPWRESSVLL